MLDLQQEPQSEILNVHYCCGCFTGVHIIRRALRRVDSNTMPRQSKVQVTSTLVSVACRNYLRRLAPVSNGFESGRAPLGIVTLC